MKLSRTLALARLGRRPEHSRPRRSDRPGIRSRLVRGQRVPVQPDVPEPELLLHLQGPVDALHIDLLHDPYPVERNPATSWKTALRFWNSQNGAGRMTPHDAVVNNKGFGETIRSINGALECDGENPDERNDRINLYRKFVGTLGTDVGGGNISC